MGKKAKESGTERLQEVRHKKDSSRGTWKIDFRIAIGICAIIIPIVGAWIFQSPPKFVGEEDEDAQVTYPNHPDYRPLACPRDLQASAPAGSVSIIIPYLNEEWFRIEATMQSIIKYTDMKLIREIMWISDGGSPDKVYASKLKLMHPTVMVHENEHNLGLITTKMNAAAKAQGSILLFLEPHILVTPGWLPPMLNAIAKNPKLLIMPALDVLDDELKYIRSSYGLWAFEWNLNIRYTNPQQVMDESSPNSYMSPGTSGGIYAIRKDFWDQLDFFDPGLTRWGGENAEASYKVWRCGGRIEIHPCSRIAHWFRNAEDRPYDVSVENMWKNYKRIAEVWFDNYTDLFYARRPEAINLDVGDLTEMRARRKELDKRLSCKSMSWYLKNVDLLMGWEAGRMAVMSKGSEMPAAPAKKASAAAEVNCGGHFESECSACPRGNGEAWCNGDCKWQADPSIVDRQQWQAGACVPKAAKINVEASDPDHDPDLDSDAKADDTYTWLEMGVSMMKEQGTHENVGSPEAGDAVSQAAIDFLIKRQWWDSALTSGAIKAPGVGSEAVATGQMASEFFEDKISVKEYKKLMASAAAFRSS